MTLAGLLLQLLICLIPVAMTGGLMWGIQHVAKGRKDGGRRPPPGPATSYHPLRSGHGSPNEEMDEEIARAKEDLGSKDAP